MYKNGLILVWCILSSIQLFLNFARLLDYGYFTSAHCISTINWKMIKLKLQLNNLILCCACKWVLRKFCSIKRVIFIIYEDCDEISCVISLTFVSCFCNSVSNLYDIFLYISSSKSVM